MTLDDPGNILEDHDAADRETHSLDRRTFIARAAALGLSAAAAGSVMTRGVEAAATRQAHVSASPVTLTYWRHTFAPEVTLETKIIKEYQALHPNVTINLVSAGSTPDENQKLLVAFAGGGAPDIIFTYNGYFSQYAALGFLQPIDLPMAAGVSSVAALQKQWLPGGSTAGNITASTMVSQATLPAMSR